MTQYNEIDEAEKLALIDKTFSGWVRSITIGDVIGLLGIVLIVTLLYVFNV